MRFRQSLPVLIWAGVIFVFSSFPNPPGATGNEWQSNLAHLTEYAVLAVLGWLWLRALRRSWNTLLVAGVTWLGCIAYGASDEFHQSFVPNRDASAMDVGFDALGAFLALASQSAWAYARDRRKRP